MSGRNGERWKGDGFGLNVLLYVKMPMAVNDKGRGNDIIRYGKYRAMEEIKRYDLYMSFLFKATFNFANPILKDVE